MTVRWSIYVDLSRSLTDAERTAVGIMLDEVVPQGGSVGRLSGTVDGAYFALEAPSASEAAAAAEGLMAEVLARARVRVSFDVAVAPAAPA